MSRRSRSSRIRPTNWIAPIVVALVMGGIAYSVSDGGGGFVQRPGPSSSASGTVSLIETPAASSSLFEVGIKHPTNDRDLRLLVNPNTKETTVIEVPKGWRVEQLNFQSSLHFESSEERGFRLTDGGDWNVALRSRTGEAYSEPRLLGMMDDRHALVLARSDRLYLLDVARAGQVSVITDIPENTTVFGLSGGALWMATFTPGEGLESEPSGPSTLSRISPAGEKQIVATTKTSELFVGALSDGQRLATWLDTGLFTADGIGKKFNGFGTPLAWVDGELIVAEGKLLMRYDGQGVKHELGITLEGVPASARAVN